MAHLFSIFGILYLQKLTSLSTLGAHRTVSPSFNPKISEPAYDHRAIAIISGPVKQLAKVYHSTTGQASVS